MLGHSTKATKIRYRLVWINFEWEREGRQLRHIEDGMINVSAF